MQQSQAIGFSMGGIKKNVRLVVARWYPGFGGDVGIAIASCLTRYLFRV